MGRKRKVICILKVDLTGFADGMVAGVERKVSRVRLCWEEEE